MPGFEDEFWILLTDFGERRTVDGAWGYAVPALAGTEGHRCPRVLAEPRLEVWLRAALPADRIVPLPAGPPIERLEAIRAELADWVELLRIGRVSPECARIRSFGLRAALAGALLARRCGIAHLPFLCGTRTTSPPDGMCGPRSRAHALLEEWVVAESEVVLVPDAAARSRLGALHLRPLETIRVDRTGIESSLARPPAERRPLAVLASTRRTGANRIALAALCRIAPDLEFDWLSRRAGEHAMRARQDLRRLGLAERIRWEDEPWRGFLLGGPVAWDVLLVPDPPRDACSLLRYVIAQGGTIVAPSTGATRSDRTGWLRTPWNEDRLAELLAARLGAHRPSGATGSGSGTKGGTR